MTPPVSTEIADRQRLSHDLRSSIRAIAIYSDLMQREVQGQTMSTAKLERLSVSIAEATEELAAQLDAFTDPQIP